MRPAGCLRRAKLGKNSAWGDAVDQLRSFAAQRGAIACGDPFRPQGILELAGEHHANAGHDVIALLTLLLNDAQNRGPARFDHSNCPIEPKMHGREHCDHNEENCENEAHRCPRIHDAETNRSGGAVRIRHFAKR
jgi:hypothetical protein